MKQAKVRLYLDQPMAVGQSLALSREQAHYLFGVMRLEADDVLSVFNGADGEWRARVAQAGKRGGILVCEALSAPQSDPLDLWLLFAPIKKARTDFIVEKATEMGARKILPVLTEFTNAERVRVDRLQAHAVEAAEQCGGTFVPEVLAPRKLSALLDGWDASRQLMFCDEAEVGEERGLGLAARGPWAILIGPEGGFSEAERKRLHAMQEAHVVSLGPRILRADTAAVAAMTMWQMTLGDWK